MFLHVVFDVRAIRTVRATEPRLFLTFPFLMSREMCRIFEPLAASIAAVMTYEKTNREIEIVGYSNYVYINIISNDYIREIPTRGDIPQRTEQFRSHRVVTAEGK